MNLERNPITAIWLIIVSGLLLALINTWFFDSNLQAMHIIFFATLMGIALPLCLQIRKGVGIFSGALAIVYFVVLTITLVLIGRYFIDLQDRKEKAKDRWTQIQKRNQERFGKSVPVK